jgi:hypothetical protein
MQMFWLSKNDFVKGMDENNRKKCDGVVESM